MMRRGERLQEQGRSDEEVVARGALPTCSTGGRARGIRPLILAEHELVADSPLALAALADLVEDRLRSPRAQAPDQTPPAVVDRAHLLYR